MSSFKDHCLDEGKVKSGVKLPLFNRDGSLSDDYIMVRWSWSDNVRAVMDDMRRDLFDRLVNVTAEMTDKQKREATQENERITTMAVLDTRCAQVAGWSFSEKPTKANVTNFLKSRPDTAERIDVLSAKTKRFFTDSGESS